MGTIHNVESTEEYYGAPHEASNQHDKIPIFDEAMARKLARTIETCVRSILTDCGWNAKVSLVFLPPSPVTDKHDMWTSFVPLYSPGPPMFMVFRILAAQTACEVGAHCDVFQRLCHQACLMHNGEIAAFPTA